MKVMVLGGHGTIGTPLVSELRRRGHDVWTSDVQHHADPQSIRANVREFRELTEALDRKFDFVYHLAAEFGRKNGEDHYEALWQTNVIGTRNVLELQRRLGFKLIFASSSEIYGDVDVPVLYEELPLERSIVQQNDYAITKWVNEVQIMNFEQRYGTETMRLRFFNAYGPGEHYHQYRSVVCLFCYRALHFEPYDVYDGYRRVFMYIDDFIPTLANVVKYFFPGEVVNIGGSEYRSVRELSDLVLLTVGADDSAVRYLSEDHHNVVSKRPDIMKAVKLLNHKPSVTLEEGVPLTVEWMRQKYCATGARLGAGPRQ